MKFKQNNIENQKKRKSQFFFLSLNCILNMPFWQPIFETIQIASITQGRSFRLILKSLVTDYLDCSNVMFYLLM